MNRGEKLNRGFGLISLIIMLAMVGLIFWIMNKKFESGEIGSGNAQGILAPINAAKDAKNLIESRYNSELP